MATICITGGSGLIGTALSQYLLTKGHAIILLGRTQKPVVQAGISTALWDPEAGTIDQAAIGASDYIIHLAGAGVADERWSKKRKAAILNSRVNGGALIAKTLLGIPHHVKAVISASAIGWYGPDRGSIFTETDAPFDDFLGSTCAKWEAAIDPVEKAGVRLVKLRTGIVLSNEGGALKEFKKPLKFGLATILGSGQQMISWVHMADLCRIYAYAIEHEISGVYNLIAPNPVSNKALTLALAKKMRGNAYITAYVPAFVLKIMLGEMSIEVLKSATVSAAKIQQTGFQFLYPTIDAALNELINSSSSAQ